MHVEAMQQVQEHQITDQMEQVREEAFVATVEHVGRDVEDAAVSMRQQRGQQNGEKRRVDQNEDHTGQLGVLQERGEEQDNEAHQRVIDRVEDAGDELGRQEHRV